MLAEEEMQKYIKAGRLVASIRVDVLDRMKPGMKLLELAEHIEKMIAAGGAKPAFPVNIGINEIAAHYTPQQNDSKVIIAGDLVKIDIGAHIDGYIADMAFTYCSSKDPLIRASEKALEAGIAAIRPGATVSEVSQAISDAITATGFGPIVNLTGHGIARYDFHGSFSIPNIPNTSAHVLEEGDVLALEPFVAESAARVDDSEPIEIYQFLQKKPVRSMEGRKILQMAEADYGGLPFAKRWLARSIAPFRMSMALLELEKVGAIRTYPILKNMAGGRIAQSEHTIIVAEKPTVTTL